MATFAKPENALKRAEELINVGQKQDALQALHDLITSKRHRAWQKTLEKIMFKYVELCVDMRRGRFAKDGLIQYRIVCQQVNVNSLEEVIKHFMHLSTEKAEQARSQSQALEEALDVDDLEADKRPEDLMLSYVSGEKGKDRSDRELVTPWFKFLWETYRTVLEILRNNSKLEALYAMTAHRAFQFCKQYKRTTEFRRLCEIIRNHLANLNKYRDQRDRPDLSAPESLQLYLDTRFEQLKIATELELWQEAFRSIEDIHGLMCMVKKSPKPSLMVIYYAKLTEIFWISSSHLYHAYAWFRLFSLQKSFNKNLSQKDLQLIASSVVLAALAVPPYNHMHGASHLELENEKERNLRMANLIGFNLDPKPESRELLSRSALLSELVSKGVLSCATQEVKDLHHLLEHEFLPLDLAAKVQPLLSKISKLGGKLASAPSVPEVHLSQYVPALEKLATIRLLQQVSQVYQTMKVESLSEMIPFFDFSVMEKISVDIVKHNFIAMKIDHVKNVIIFGNLFIFSTAIDGKIKAWLYDDMGSRVDYDAPGRWCTTMLYSADGSRLFSCGTSKEGDSFLVEWNESEGAIKRHYTGFRKKSTGGVVQFDTTQNHFLAAGADGQIKFWDMDNTNVLTTIDADGELPSLPRLRFNKEGNLLAVNTADNGFKIIANAAGLRTLRVAETLGFEGLRTPLESAAIKVSGASCVTNVGPVNLKVERTSPVRPSSIPNGVESMSRSMEKPRTGDDVIDKAKPWQLMEVVDPSECRAVTLPDSADASSKVVRLLYTNSAVGILALGSNGVQKLWKWSRNDQNPTGKATASIVPQHWQPNSGLLMANDVAGVKLEEAVPCIALSKNDSYVMSAAGGKVSLFNMMTFKVMTTFMSPPPASTYLAFHPQDNNIIAIGMEDSTIHIYNVRVDEVKSKLKGHQKRITGLAFSTSLNILVSSGADAQLCVWSIDTWEKRKSFTIQIPAGKAPAGDTRVQFHSDQTRLLVVHETQLSIYDASKMDRIRQWVPQDPLPAPISCATFSCNSQLVFATFCDGNIGVFDADSLRLRCRISSSAYSSSAAMNGSPIYPLVVAAHPQEANQLAIGLTDGSIKVIEPPESEGKWGTSPPVDNGMLNGRTTSSSTASNHTPDQLQR